VATEVTVFMAKIRRHEHTVFSSESSCKIKKESDQKAQERRWADDKGKN
jgi:hypothetical protein